MNPHRVQFLYKNSRGETNLRRVLPHRIVFTATEWYPDPQWLLEAYDLDRLTNRTFMMSGISQWVHSPDVIQEA